MSSFNASRSNPNVELTDETYETIDLYLGSQIGSIPLAGYTNKNAGFTCVLANPIMLDISHRYVIALIKGEVDISQYTTRYYDISIYCDLLEYQYEYNNKTQLLYKSYGNRFVPATADIELGLFDVANIAWKFINPTTKVIREISFWILDDTGQPLNTPLPPAFSYPSNFNILIKKVNSRVVAVTQL
tara:strand:+ start:80 stop:640 length:561 start_codon:yes stop_codon:yes gene_type:complete